MSSGARVVLVVVAVVVAGGVAVYALSGGDGGDETPPTNSNLPFGGTPLPDLPGMPTAAPGTGPIGPERPETGRQAPDFALVDVYGSGEVLRLSDFRGRPVVLNWYASWCAPCKDELPTYQAAHEALGDAVTFLAVNLIEDEDAALGILEELGVTFPAVLDPSGAVSDRWRIFTMPTTYFIGADGVIVGQQIGPVSEGQLVARLGELGIEYAPASSD